MNKQTYQSTLGMSASFYPGFEYEKPPSKPASTSPSRRPSTLPLPKSSKHTPPAKTSRDRTSNGYSTLGNSGVPAENGMHSSQMNSPGIVLSLMRPNCLSSALL